MGKIIKKEEDVKKKLDVEEWEEITGDQLTRFTDMCAKIDPAVAANIIEQFPDFGANSLLMVQTFQESVQTALSDAKQSNVAVLQANQMILTELAKLLEKNDLAQSEREYVVEKMLEVSQNMAQQDQAHKEFLLRVLGGVGKAAAAVAVATVGVLAAAKIEKK